MVKESFFRDFLKKHVKPPNLNVAMRNDVKTMPNELMESKQTLPLLWRNGLSCRQVNLPLKWVVNSRNTHMLPLLVAISNQWQHQARASKLVYFNSDRDALLASFTAHLGIYSASIYFIKCFSIVPKFFFVAERHRIDTMPLKRTGLSVYYSFIQYTEVSWKYMI